LLHQEDVDARDKRGHDVSAIGAVGMRYVIVGATAGLGRALAERLAADKHDLLLVGRDERDLDAIAADLSLRFGIQIKVLAGDVAQPETLFERLNAVLGAWTRLDGLLLPIAVTSDEDTLDLPQQRIDEIVSVNFLSIVAMTKLTLPYLTGEGGGVIVGFGSVAAARGRSHNISYSASKRALESYFESLRHALSERGIRVQFYVLGFLDTNLAYGVRTLLPKADPRRLADKVVRQLGKDVGVRYFPAWWQPICIALRVAPWWLMRRLTLRHPHE
jgi:decaprenylphospho-beta-D-erythro-pentofuranosid-2-ulose 2-reductase